LLVFRQTVQFISVSRAGPRVKHTFSG